MTFYLEKGYFNISQLHCFCCIFDRINGINKLEQNNVQCISLGSGKQYADKPT